MQEIGKLKRLPNILAVRITDIAKAEGIGALASREANSSECRQLIAEFVGDEWEEMRAVFYRFMRAIEHALSARREYLTKDGQIVQGDQTTMCASGCDEALPRLPDGQPTGAEATGAEGQEADASGARRDAEGKQEITGSGADTLSSLHVQYAV